jgi:hypothetical protein
MPSIKYLVTIGGETKKLEMQRTQKEFENYANAVIKQARNILEKEDKNASGNLSKSMNYSFKINGKEFALSFDFDGAPYWDFVESGVRGAVSEKKAPNSPFKFGSGTGEKGKLVPAIDRWTIVKPIKAVRDAKGRFIARKQLVRTIAITVYRYGIKPTPFIRPTMRILFKKYESRISSAMASDLYHFYKEELPNNFEIVIIL